MFGCLKLEGYISDLLGVTRPNSPMHIRQLRRIGRQRRGLRSIFHTTAAVSGFGCSGL